jgi:hypothetical protein
MRMTLVVWSVDVFRRVWWNSLVVMKIHLFVSLPASAPIKLPEQEPPRIAEELMQSFHTGVGSIAQFPSLVVKRSVLLAHLGDKLRSTVPQFL